MWGTLQYVILVPLVYLAVLWAVLGAGFRIVAILRAPPHPHTLQIFPDGTTGGSVLGDALLLPTVRRSDPALWVLLGVFHLGVAVLFLAHVDLFGGIRIMPEASVHMIGRGFVGLLVLASVLGLLLRRFGTPVRELSVPADFLLLLFLLLLMLSGCVISWGNSWTEYGFLISKQDFALYFDGLARLSLADPADSLNPVHLHMVTAHILLADLFLLVLPFSKVMHTFFAIPLNALRRG